MVTAILCVGGAVLFYSDLGERSLSTYQERILRLTVQERYDSERTDLVQTAYAMVLTHPVFGAGLASFPLYSTGFYAHNIFLETVSETGGVGVCLLLLPLIAFVVFSVRHWSLVDRRQSVHLSPHWYMRSSAETYSIPGPCSYSSSWPPQLSW